MVSFLYAPMLTFADGNIGGLGSLWKDVKSQWLAPLFLAVVAVMAVVFVKNRQWTALISFVGIAVVVAALMFGGASLFGTDGGEANKGLASIAVNAGNKVAAGGN